MIITLIDITSSLDDVLIIVKRKIDAKGLLVLVLYCACREMKYIHYFKSCGVIL